MENHTPGNRVNALYEGEHWTMCDRCNYPMLTLREFEIDQIVEAPAVEPDAGDYIFWGWGVFVWGIVVRYVFGGITMMFRTRKLAKLKVSVLPGYPHSLVCPKCLNVRRKR